MNILKYIEIDLDAFYIFLKYLVLPICDLSSYPGVRVRGVPQDPDLAGLPLIGPRQHCQGH